MSPKFTSRLIVLLFIAAMLLTAMLPMLEGFKRLLIIIEFFSMLYVMSRA